MADLRATVNQSNPSLTADGVDVGIRATRIGQMMTVDWKTNLVLAGRAFNVTVGGITTGAAELGIVGGGNGTVVDTDQPELAIGTPEGYYHIPLMCRSAVLVDCDADAEAGSIILFADTAKAIPKPLAASSTVETAICLVDGLAGSVSDIQSAVTTDITDPACSMILDIALMRTSEITAAGAHDIELKMDYDPSVPTLLKGPCSVVGCWGGTAGVTGFMTYNWAEVPVSWFE